MEKVIFKEEILLYFDELISILFDREYFSYEKNAILYVDKIVDFIISEINSFPHKPTPQKLRYLGTNYIFIKRIIELLGTYSLKDKILYF